MAHLTSEQRYTIEVLLNKNYSKSKIASIIDKDRSVVYREIARNKDGRSGEYRSDLAERKYQSRLKSKPKKEHFTASIKQRVDKLLKDDFSPEQIVGKSKKDGNPMVSHERIYQYIWEDKKNKGQLHKHLRHQGRRYRKRGAAKDTRGIIKNRIDIDNRPKEVEKRLRFGDLEGDTIIGKNHKGAIVTLNDRSAGMLKMRKVNTREAEEVERALIEMISEWSPFDIRTLTLDNGKEFARHEQVTEQTGVDIYFAKPYHPWQRGSNENLNGLIRQYIPKKTDFSLIDEADIKYIEEKLNNRPRKRYNYDSPKERMDKLLFNKSVAFVT